MKLFYATLSTETNTFSPVPTGLNAWLAGTLVRFHETESPTARFVRQSLRPLLEWVVAEGGRSKWACWRTQHPVA
jgi:microcystin degradation protein MlrC